MVKLRVKHVGWLTALLVLLVACGLLWLSNHLGRQIAHHVHATTLQLSVAAFGQAGDDSLSHSTVSSRSSYSLTLSDDATDTLHIEHIIRHGPVLLTRAPQFAVEFGAAWVVSTLYFPARYSLPPLQVNTTIDYDGTATSHFNYGPVSFGSLGSLNESLEWEGMTGKLVYHRFSSEMSAHLALGAMVSRSALAEASFGGGHLLASGPINRFSGHRTLQVAFSHAQITYLEDNRRYGITDAEASLDSVDTSPHSTVRFKANAKQIDANGQLFELGHADLTLERIAAALLLDAEPATLMEALALLLQHKPSITVDAGVTSPSGPADVYLKVSAGPFGLEFLTGNAAKAFIRTVEAIGQFTLPRPLLESVLRQQFRSLEQDNAALRDFAGKTPLDNTDQVAANARQQMSMLEANALVLPVDGALTSSMMLNQGVLTINERQFDLFSLLLPFLE